MTDLIRRVRQDLGLSQAKFAAELGVSRQAVYYWEMGTATPSWSNLEKIADLAKLDLFVEFAPSDAHPVRLPASPETIRAMATVLKR